MWTRQYSSETWYSSLSFLSAVQNILSISYHNKITNLCQRFTLLAIRMINYHSSECDLAFASELAIVNISWQLMLSEWHPCLLHLTWWRNGNDWAKIIFKNVGVYNSGTLKLMNFRTTILSNANEPFFQFFFLSRRDNCTVLFFNIYFLIPGCYKYYFGNTIKLVHKL